MEDAIKQQHPDADVELVRGRGGIFDVVVDGRRIFSKHEESRFPDNGEILEALS